MGRYLVAARDIEPLELVLWDRAAAVGPGADTLPVCLECFKKVESREGGGGPAFLCPGCSFPLCGPKCVAGSLHKEECSIFSKLQKKPQFEDLNEKNPIYAAIAPLRLLLLKRSNPSLWAMVISLMDHNEDRFIADPTMCLSFQMIVDFFLVELRMTEFSEEEIRHVIGVLLTNGFENDHEGVTGRAVYPNLSLCSHSCRANLRHAISPGFQVALQAQVAIKKGTELTIRYTHMLQGHLKRRRQIEDVWFFSCSCPRCCDPSESGSLASAVFCPACRNGLMLPTSSLDLASEWECLGVGALGSGCGAIMEAEAVVKLEEQVDKALEEVNLTSVEALQGLLKTFQTSLPPSHYLIVIIKRYIQDALPPLDLLTVEQLEEKARFCRSFIRYLGRLDPGYSQHLGLTTIELSKVQLELARRRTALGELGRDQLVAQVKENMVLQQQASKWLQVVTVEGLVGGVTKQS